MRITSDTPPADWLPNTMLAELGQQVPVVTLREAEILLRRIGAIHTFEWTHVEPHPADGGLAATEPTSGPPAGTVLARGTAYGSDPWAITDQLPQELPAGTVISIQDNDSFSTAAVEPGPADEASAPNPDQYSPLQWRLRELANQIDQLAAQPGPAATKMTAVDIDSTQPPPAGSGVDLINKLNALREEAAVHYWPPGLSVQLTGLAREAHPDVIRDVVHDGIEFAQFAADRRIMNLAAMDDTELREAVQPLNQEQLAIAQQIAGVGTPEWWQEATLGEFADRLVQAEEWRHLSLSAQHVWNQINERLHETKLPALEAANDAIGYVSPDVAGEVAARLEHSRLTTLTSPAAGSDHHSAAGSDPVDVSGLSPQAAARTREIAQQRAAHAATAQQAGAQPTPPGDVAQPMPPAAGTRDLDPGADADASPSA